MHAGYQTRHASSPPSPREQWAGELSLSSSEGESHTHTSLTILCSREMHLTDCWPPPHRETLASPLQRGEWMTLGPGRNCYAGAMGQSDAYGTLLAAAYLRTGSIVPTGQRSGMEARHTCSGLTNVWVTWYVEGWGFPRERLESTKRG